MALEQLTQASPALRSHTKNDSLAHILILAHVTDQAFRFCVLVQESIRVLNELRQRLPPMKNVFALLDPP